jgi:hypothetical protein
MNTEQARMLEEVQADASGLEPVPSVSPKTTRPQWRGSAGWILACLGGGGLLIAAVIAWGYWQFGSLSCTLAYLNGERMLVDPGMLSFGTARVGEDRDLHVTIRNQTGKDVKILGARSTCGCIAAVEKFPLSIVDGARQELTVHVWFTDKDSAFEKRVDYYTDAESNPVIAVAVRGTIMD